MGAMVLIFVVSGCEIIPQTMTPEPTNEPTAEPTTTTSEPPAAPQPQTLEFEIEDKEDVPVKKAIDQTATYTVEFIADWSATTHPDYYPSNAHFSPFIAYSHGNEAGSEIFKVGGTATPGVEEMAETGLPVPLNKEIDVIISKKLAHAKAQGVRIDSPGKISAELEFTTDNSYITFVSMLAPSPDWFVSQFTNLIQDDEWIDNITLSLITYDAGSDSGATLTAADKDTNPKEAIIVFDDYLQGLGRLVLTRIK